LTTEVGSSEEAVESLGAPLLHVDLHRVAVALLLHLGCSDVVLLLVVGEAAPLLRGDRRESVELPLRFGVLLLQPLLVVLEPEEERVGGSSRLAGGTVLNGGSGGVMGR
jgi:hypothetical protein